MLPNKQEIKNHYDCNVPTKIEKPISKTALQRATHPLLRFADCHFAKNNQKLLENDICKNKFLFFMVESKNPEIDKSLFRTLIGRGVVDDNEVRLISFTIDNERVYIIELEKTKTRRNRLAMFILVNPNPQQNYRFDHILKKSMKFFHPNETMKGRSIVDRDKEMSYNLFLNIEKIKTRFNQTSLEQFILDVTSMVSDNYSHLSKQLYKNENNREFCADVCAIFNILDECKFLIKKTEKQCMPKTPLFHRSKLDQDNEEIENIIKTSKSLDKYGIVGLINQTALKQGIIENFETGQEYIFKHKQVFKSLFRYRKTGTWTSKKYINRTNLIYLEKQIDSDKCIEICEDICKRKDTITTSITEEDGTEIKKKIVHFEQFYFNKIVDKYKCDIDHIFFDASTIKKTFVIAAVAIVPYIEEEEKYVPIEAMKFTYKTIMLFAFPNVVELDESGKQIEQFFGASLYKRILEMIIEVFPKIKSITTDFESAVINGSLGAGLVHWGCLVHYNTNLENRFSKAKQRGLKIASKMRTILSTLPFIKLSVNERKLLEYIEELERDITRDDDREILNEIWSYYFQRKGKNDKRHKIIFNHNAFSLLDRIDQFKLTNNAVERVFKKLKSNLGGFAEKVKENHYQMTVELLIDHLYKQHISNEFVGQCKPHFKPSRYNEIIRHAESTLFNVIYEYKSDLKTGNLTQIRTSKRIRKSKRAGLEEEEEDIEQFELLTDNKHRKLLSHETPQQNEYQHIRSSRIKSRSDILQKRRAESANEQLGETIVDLKKENMRLKREKLILNREKNGLELKLNVVQEKRRGLEFEAKDGIQKGIKGEQKRIDDISVQSGVLEVIRDKTLNRNESGHEIQVTTMDVESSSEFEKGKGDLKKKLDAPFKKTNPFITNNEKNDGVKLIIGALDGVIIFQEKQLIKNCLGYSMKMIESYFQNNNIIHACICLGDDQVVSVCVLFVDQNQRQAEIIALGTSVLHQRKGYGSSLIREVADELCMWFGIEFLTVLSNKKTVVFFKTLGFQHFTPLKHNLCHLYTINYQKKLSLVLETQLTIKSNKNVKKIKEMFAFFKEKIIEVGSHFKRTPKDTKSEPRPAEVFGLCKRSGISDGNDLQVCEEEIICSKKIKMTELENENLKKMLKEEQSKFEAINQIAEVERMRAEEAQLKAENERLAKEIALNHNIELLERIKQLEDVQMSILSGPSKGISNLKQFKQKGGFQHGHDDFRIK